MNLECPWATPGCDEFDECFLCLEAAQEADESAYCGDRLEDAEQFHPGGEK